MKKEPYLNLISTFLMQLMCILNPLFVRIFIKKIHQILNVKLFPIPCSKARKSFNKY